MVKTNNYILNTKYFTKKETHTIYRLFFTSFVPEVDSKQVSECGKHIDPYVLIYILIIQHIYVDLDVL